MKTEAFCPIGWLSPDGILHRCLYHDHAALAIDLVEEYVGSQSAEYSLEQQGWIRITYDVPDVLTVVYYLQNTPKSSLRFVPLRGHWGNYKGIPQVTNAQAAWLDANDEWLGPNGREYVQAERFWE